RVALARRIETCGGSGNGRNGFETFKRLARAADERTVRANARGNTGLRAALEQRPEQLLGLLRARQLRDSGDQRQRVRKQLGHRVAAAEHSAERVPAAAEHLRELVEDAAA